MNEVAGIIKVDTVLSVKILVLANSIYYRTQKPLELIEDALTKIGLREVMNAVFIYAMKKLYRGSNRKYEKYLRYMGININNGFIGTKVG